MKAFFLIFILLILGAVFILPGVILKPIIEKAGTELLKTPVTVDTAKLSLTSGDLLIEGLKVRNPEPFTKGNAVNIGKFNVQLDVMSLLSPTIHVKNIEFSDSSLLFETDTQSSNLGTLGNNIKNLSSNDEAKNTEPAQQDSSEEGKNIIINKLKIAGITVKAILSGVANQNLETEMTIPEIEMTDIGKDQDTTIAQAIEIVAKNVQQYMGTDMTGQAKRMLHNAKDQIKNFGKDLSKDIDGSVDKLKGLFN